RGDGGGRESRIPPSLYHGARRRPRRRWRRLGRRGRGKDKAMTISKELEATLQLAIAEAKRRHHEYLTLEHLLLALCADPAAAKNLPALGPDFARLTQELEGFFRRQL